MHVPAAVILSGCEAACASCGVRNTYFLFDMVSSPVALEVKRSLFLGVFSCPLALGEAHLVLGLFVLVLAT